MTESSMRIWTGDSLTDAEFSAIIERLRNLRQFDLDQYKDRCVKRRIAKRLRACKVSDFGSYLKRLEIDRQELDTLLATISIHVSQFFRNPDTFRVIEQKILPDLCSRARAAGHSKLTLWSAGCAAGEEPYSLALLVDDLSADDLEIRVLATDISEPVLETARTGRPPKDRDLTFSAFEKTPCSPVPVTERRTTHDPLVDGIHRPGIHGSAGYLELATCRSTACVSPPGREGDLDQIHGRRRRKRRRIRPAPRRMLVLPSADAIRHAGPIKWFSP